MEKKKKNVAASTVFILRSPHYRLSAFEAHLFEESGIHHLKAQTPHTDIQPAIARLQGNHVGWKNKGFFLQFSRAKGAETTDSAKEGWSIGNFDGGWVLSTVYSIISGCNFGMPNSDVHILRKRKRNLVDQSNPCEKVPAKVCHTTNSGKYEKIAIENMISETTLIQIYFNSPKRKSLPHCSKIKHYYNILLS